MSSQNDLSGDPAELRRRSEERAREKERPASEDHGGLSPEDAQRTLHELQAHQIELEMQNEELRQTQAELDASRARYFDLYDLAPIAYCTISEQGLILEANLAAASLLGVERSALVGKRLTRFILSEDEDIYYRHRKLLFETGAPQTCELRMVKQDGTVFWARLEATAAEDARGVTVSRVMMSDNPERERAAEALRDANWRLASTIEGTHVGTWEWNVQTGETVFNDIWAQILGYTLDELAPISIKTWDALAHPDDLKDVYKLVERHFAGELPYYDHECRMKHKDGHWVWVQDRGRLISRTADGKPLMMFGTHTDVTERKQAEAALAQSHILLSSLACLVPGVIYQYRLYPDGRSAFPYSSPGMNDIYEVTPEEVREDASPVFGRLHPDDYDHVADSIQESARTLQTFYCEFRVVLPRQGLRWRWSQAHPERMADGGTLWHGIISDTTERKQAEEEKAKLEAQLQQAQKMESVGRLAGGVAHDFNNLLTVINGYSQMLLGKLSAGDPMRANLEEIYKAGERAAGLTRQLLAFSRKQVLEPRRLHLNHVVEEMRPMLERLAGEDVEVRVALNAESETVHADPHQLERVVMNLVVNARDAMRDGGELLIETSNMELDETYVQSHPEARVGRYVMLAVSDNGAGMDEETRRQIFEPFFTTKGVGKGTGLGLSMAQGIVVQSGGHIEVYSEPGQGTTFKIYLPALARTEADAGLPAAVPALGGKETVLVVEDQAEVRDYAVTVLKEYGYRVIPAENAGEALLACERDGERIHLVLTDVVMPNISGRELASRLKKTWPRIKVLFMSGYTDNVIVYHGVLEEGVDFIHKPFSPEELAEKVRAVLGPPARAARILVADDEAGVRSFLRAVLEQGGYEVIEAADGKQVLKQVRAGHVDLVITDLVMPGQEGIETIRALRKETPDIGIIAITGKFEGPFLKMVQMLGADAVLTKPVSAESLLAKAAEVLKLGR